DGISIQFDATTCPNNARWEVLQVLETLPELMQHLTADELGKKLVNEKIKSIEITVSDHARTTLDQYVLSIQLTTPFASTLNAENQNIKNEIESLSKLRFALQMHTSHLFYFFVVYHVACHNSKSPLTQLL